MNRLLARGFHTGGREAERRKRRPVKPARATPMLAFLQGQAAELTAARAQQQPQGLTAVTATAARGNLESCASRHMAADGAPSISDLVLYHYPLTRSVRVLWLLHELGEGVVGEFTVKRVELLAGEGRSASFMALNPNHAVPAVTFTDAAGEQCTMFESAGIVQFLADALAPGQLAPVTGPTRQRADYERWMWFAGSWMDQLLWQIRQHGKGGILPEVDKDPRVVARTEDKWRSEIEPQVAAQLAASGGPYLFGNAFSAADCLVGHTLRWSQAYGLSQDEPLIESYMDALAERSGFQAAYSSQLSPTFTDRLITKYKQCD